MKQSHVTHHSYPAPRRMSVKTGEREINEEVIEVVKGEILVELRKRIIPTYATQPWTLAGVLSTIRAGGQFGGSGNHDFAPGVAEFAGDARIVWSELETEVSHAA